MDTTKNFFDAWMNTQSKFVDNLMDTSKKIQETLNNGEVFEKSVELYNQWFDNQKSLTTTMLQALNDPVNQENTPDFFKNWMESQMQIGKKWMEYLNYASSNSDDASLEKYIANMQLLYDEWNQIYNQLFTHIDADSASGKPNPFDFLKNNFSNIINNSNTYMKMFELWQPIYKMMQSNSVGLDSLMKILDTNKYKEVLNGIFHFMNPEKTKNFQVMMKQYNDLMINMLGNKASLPFQPEIISQMLSGNQIDQNLATLAQITAQFSEHFNKFVTPYYTMIPAGREKEMFGHMTQVQHKYTIYYIKGLEMQHLVYQSGQKSIEKAVQKIMQLSAEKSELISFDEFYVTWVNLMEADMIQLFGSVSYSKLQGELLSLGLEIKGSLDKQMELLLAPVPVVPRSELDELNRTIHELKTKVRAMEKKLKSQLEPK